MQKQLIRWVCAPLVLAAATLTGCAKNPNPNDPLEPYNRAMFAFNQDVDHLVIRPVAVTYNALTPQPVKTGVSNFFNNLYELTSFPNDFLQGNFKYMAVDFWRFILNSTLGVGGLFDVATKIGIQPHSESFGLTLAKWRGGKSAPYFVMPIFGPATIQSAVGFGVDAFTTPWPYINNNYLAYIPPAVGLINLRAQYLDADKLINTAFDPYVFVRDAYLQKQNQKIAENQALGKEPSKMENQPVNNTPSKPENEVLDKETASVNE